MLFSQKIPFHVAARLTPRFWVTHLLRFATARHYYRLFTIICAIRDYSHYSYYLLFWTIRFPYSRLFAIRYSLFAFRVFQTPCTKWLTKTQIQGFFCRLQRRDAKNRAYLETEDVECLVKVTERQELLDEIADEVGLKHPITFDVYDLCEYYGSYCFNSTDMPCRN